MTFDVSCSTGLVGLSDRDCPCIDGEAPAAYNESSSGYYLTDAEYGFPLVEAIFDDAQCGDGGIWDTLEKARDKAVNEFVTDLSAALYQVRESRYKIFSGQVGELKASGTTRLSGRTYSGVAFKPKVVKGASLIIRSVTLGIDTSTNATVSLYSDIDGLIESWQFQTVGGQMTKHELAQTVTIELAKKDGTQPIYYLTHSAEDDYKVLNNKLTCCSKKKDWMHYLNVSTFDSNTLSGAGNGKQGNGLSFNAHIACDSMAWLCDLDVIEGYYATSVIARGIQMKGAIKLLNKVLKSGKIDRYTLSERESLYGQLRGLQKSYEKNIAFLSNNVPADVSDCTKCKSNISKSAILV